MALGALGLTAGALLFAAAAEPQRAPDLRLVEDVLSLEELVGGCASMLGIGVHFDPAGLADTITVRTSDQVSVEALWALTNRALVERDLACIQAPGEATLTIVPLERAPSLARIERGGIEEARAGFVRAVAETQLETPTGLIEAVRATLSPAGSITPMPGARALLIADLAPHVEQALELLDFWEAIQADVVVEEFRPRHITPIALAALIERVGSAKRQVTGQGPHGKVVASPESASVLVVAPPAELDGFLSIVRRFDRPEPRETREYFPQSVALEDAARLIEASARRDGSSLAPPTVERDERTGALMVTGTDAEQREVRDLLERIDGRPRAAASLRVIPVRHRGVVELQELVERFLEPGAFVSGGTGGPIDAKAPPLARAVEALASDAAPRTLVLHADDGANRLVARGTARELDDLEELVELLDVRHPQVLVETLVVTLSDGQTRDLGVELQKLGTSGDTLVQLSSLFGLRSPDPASAALGPATGTGFGGVVLDPGSFSAVVRALDTVQHGRTLIRPKVLVDNNQEASLDSVLQSPYASTNASDTVATTSFGGTQDAGTAISVKPQITDGDQLLLDYSVSLSSFVGDSADPSLPPPRQENKLESTVTIPDGYTVVVGGLEIESDAEAEDRVPGLGEIPLLGALFRNRSQTSQRTRFFVFLRASIMRSQGFEELKHISGAASGAAGLPPDWPVLEPRVMR